MALKIYHFKMMSMIFKDVSTISESRYFVWEEVEWNFFNIAGIDNLMFNPVMRNVVFFIKSP